MIRSVVAASAMLIAGHAAAAERVLVECLEPNGSSYYFEGGIVPPGQGGARSDGMTGGRIRLVQLREGAAPVIETRDAAGAVVRMNTAHTAAFTQPRPDGGISIVSSTDNPDQKTIDTFLFNLNGALVGTVVWQFAKLNLAVTKTSTFTAPCRAGF